MRLLGSSRRSPSRYLLLKLNGFLKSVVLLIVGVLASWGALSLRSGKANALRVVQGTAQEGGDDKEEKGGGPEKYLFVWAGDQARTHPDSLAVVNFDDRSTDYGKVITTVPLPQPGATGNEPHHVGLSRDGKTFGCGGLLSV